MKPQLETVEWNGTSRFCLLHFAEHVFDPVLLGSVTFVRMRGPETSSCREESERAQAFLEDGPC